ncbi:MAG: hypothetical protein IKT27_00185 [Clostridia bacterium]|nr:hypothetical protein [Clostridia bacterium]
MSAYNDNNDSYDQEIEDLIYSDDKTRQEDIKRLKKRNELLSSLNEGMER